MLRFRKQRTQGAVSPSASSGDKSKSSRELGPVSSCRTVCVQFLALAAALVVVFAASTGMFGSDVSQELADATSFGTAGEASALLTPTSQNGNGQSSSNAERRDDSIAASANARKPPVVGYAISLIECNGVEGAGLVDAAIVLRHSVHQNSVRNPESGSKYDYKMYAIVHKQAERCAPFLERAGFEVLVRQPPVNPRDIKGDYLRKNIRRELCCGADEFVKLYAYQLFNEKVVVHLDIDFIFHKPMDDVIDVMLGDRTNQDRIPVEGDFVWPKGEIEAMITRDWPSVNVPGRKAGFQAGFWVLKPSQKHFDKLVEIILEGNYVEGFTRENGWYGLGYGGFVGGMAMQGLLAYYYDVVVPDSWVELNHCRFNHIGFFVKTKGRCRNGKETCEPCDATPVEDIFSVHYTVCRKPWQCMAIGSLEPKGKTMGRKQTINQRNTDIGHCMDLMKIWHGHRTDLEDKLYRLTGNELVTKGRSGEYNQDSFFGHCKSDQEIGYLKLAYGDESILKRIPELYDTH